MFKAWITKLLLVSLIFSGTAFGDVVSLDSNFVPGQSDVTTKLNNDRNALTNGVNNVRGVFAGSIQSSGQVKAATIGAENMADDANPVNRTNEGASCPDLVASGLLPATSSSLVLTIPTGIAYPDGVRISKTSSTAATLTASKWTYYYLLTSGSFATNVVTIGASMPTPPASSAVLFRASSDSSTINTVTDLRKTSCASGPFSAISDVTGEASIGDLLANGASVRRFSPAGRTPQGFVRGFFISFDTTTTFKVTSGAAYINGKYRIVSTDTTLTTSNDDPTNGISGLDTGSVTGGPLRYFVYADADQDAVKTASFSYSTSGTAPTGVTNSRLIGSINIDNNNLFTSFDTVTAGAIGEKELIGAWVNFDGTATVIGIADSFNVSGLIDGGTGVYTVTIDSDFNNAKFAPVCTGGAASAEYCAINTVAAGSVVINTKNSTTNAAVDSKVYFMAVGDTRK